MKSFLFSLFILLYSSHGLTTNLPRTALTIGSHRFEVEIAKSQEALEKGLMHRKALASGSGMLFIYPITRLLTMWMKETPLPLDMIFLDEHKQIVHIHHSAQPYSLARISSLSPARYVIEIKGGLSKKLSIKVGDTVSFPDL